jgi:hypothetical protein
MSSYQNLYNVQDLVDTIQGDSATNANIKTTQAAANTIFDEAGFTTPVIPTADGNGLPSHKVPNNRIGENKRQMMTWFVPDFGTVGMYVNPQSISYKEEKLITQERTKGGYNLQYWGERLMTLHINGNTGSSGIEGINVLREIYRAEQYGFDSIGLTLASENSSANSIQSSITSAFGNSLGGSIASGAISTLFGTDASTQSLSTRDLPNLASSAFSVEMYYQGWVHRGYFNSFSFEESVSSLGLFTYQIEFVVVERRGYRYNNLPWQKSAISGPSGDNIPRSFSTVKE